ncbi:MAG: long-chain acyl-CoA synthetase, partial [Myxococcota bacterium]
MAASTKSLYCDLSTGLIEPPAAPKSNVIKSLAVGGQSTFVELFERRVAASGDTCALKHHVGSSWVEISWQSWHDAARTVAAALVSLGLKAGDRVGLVVPTSAEWVFSDIGILMAAGVTVPVYPSAGGERGRYALTHSGVRFAIVSGQAELDWLRDSGITLERVIVVQPVEEPGEAISWDGFLEAGRLADVELELSERARSLQPSDLATVVYTSGTTGASKGVMLTHGNLTWEAETVQTLGLTDDDVQLLLLPLAHAFARVLYGGFVFCGGVTVFSRGREALLDDLREVEPTFFAAVPGLYEALHGRICSAAERRGGFHWKMFQWAVRLGAEVSEMEQRGQAVGTGLRLEHQTAVRLVGKRISEVFGPGMRLLISGQGALAEPISQFFMGFGIEVLEGYGLTEAGGATHLNRPGATRTGTVGTPFPGVEAEIGVRNEVWIRSPGVMHGYMGAANATAAALNDDGWLRTGDVGEIDGDGYLKITGRMRDLILTSAGKRVSPLHIESLLRTSQWVSQVLVHGEGRPYLTALITLDQDTVSEWASELGLEALDFGELARHPRIYALVESNINDNNTALPSYEQVRKFAILDHRFSPDDDEVTPTDELKRTVIEGR